MLDKLRISATKRSVNLVGFILLLLIAPIVLGYYALGLNHWDISMPMIYGHGDDIWQMTLTKALADTGWVLSNPFLGAPEVASWHHNAAAQTSALHSVIMLGLSLFINDPVTLQQFYYLLNFSLISITSYYACRLLSLPKLIAICVGFLFAFTTFRFGFLLYAFLPNYFTVPLAIVLVVWVMQGKFEVGASPPEGKNLRGFVFSLVRNRQFLLGGIFAVSVAVADGYYAFFTLLLLGFATLCRFLIVGWKEPRRLIPAITYTSLLLVAALGVQVPLYFYKQQHIEEFSPNGQEDPALTKHSFEAEVYSSSLKFLVSPTIEHRLSIFRGVAAKVNASSTAARKFEVLPVAPLGMLPSVLLVVAFLALILPILRKRFPICARQQEDLELIDALLPLIFFVFLCSIYGGIGTIIALVFPTIRAYDRFAIFLIFLLLLFGAKLGLNLLLSYGGRKKLVAAALMVLITVLALFDQVPITSDSRNESGAIRFRAERNFVQRLEHSLPAGSMVYQFPYSQYLRDSKYYGWGSFSHVRLYLHSHSLRWSNGGAKNSPADNWNYRLSKLPLSQLVSEIEAVGFKSLVIDRTVVKGNEYADIRNNLTEMGYVVIEDGPSNFSYVILRDPGFRINYDEHYVNIQSLDLISKSKAAKSPLPELLVGDKIRTFISNYSGVLPAHIAKLDYPELFFDGSVLIRGNGDSPVAPLSDMKGDLTCQMVLDAGGTGNKAIELNLTNWSSFNWSLSTGSFPFRIGYHIENSDGTIALWDNGYRAQINGIIKAGESKAVSIPLKSIPSLNDGTKRLRFVLVQDANAWFSEISCVVET